MVNPQIQNYVARQLTEQAKILRLSAYDRKGAKRPRRKFYPRMEAHVNNFLKGGEEPRWITIPGLRGVGKTTILAQMFFDYREKFNGRILYVSMDEAVKKLGSSLFELLDAYEDLLGESFPSLSDNVLLLVDEVHFDSKWQSALKSLYDKSRRVFIVSTGSSAISISRTADVARRSLMERMHPLKFTEYSEISDALSGNDREPFPEKLSWQIGSALFESANARDAHSKLHGIQGKVLSCWQEYDIRSIERYIRYYSLPSVIPFRDNASIYSTLNGVVDRIVEKDLPAIKSFSPDVLAKIPSLLFLAASSDTRSIGAFAKDLKGIDAKTLASVFQAMEEAELLLRIYPFSLSAPKKVRKPSKYLFAASSIRAALIHLTDSRAIESRHRGKLLEDSVGMYMHCRLQDSVGSSLGYDDSKGGADFVADTGRARIAVETGWNKKDAGQAVKTIQSARAHYGLLVTNSPVLEHRDNVLTVPLEYFFLL